LEGAVVHSEYSQSIKRGKRETEGGPAHSRGKRTDTGSFHLQPSAKEKKKKA